MKIAVSVGHNPTKPGATYENFSEYSECVLIVAQIVSELQHKQHLAYLIGTSTLKNKVANINDLNVDCAIEIHLNAANKKATGCETLYCPGSESGMELAESIQSSLVTTTKNKDRGIKEGWYRMIKPPNPNAIEDYFLKATNCPAVIVEPYFIDSEFEFYKDKYEEIANSIVNGLLKWR